jgi:hypothetical protein
MNIKAIASSPLVFVLGIVLAWFGGRASAPTKVVTTEKLTEVRRETSVVEKKIDLREIQALLTQFAQNVQKNIAVRRTEDIRPDGSKTIVEETTDTSKTDTKSSSEVKKETTATVTDNTRVWKETVRVEEKITLVERLRPPDRWSLGVIAGVNLPRLLSGDVQNYIPGIPNQVVVGGVVERHLFWSVYTGVWGNSRGDAGLQLRVGF